MNVLAFPREILEQILHKPQSARMVSQTCREALGVTRGMFYTTITEATTGGQYKITRKVLTLIGPYFKSSITLGSGLITTKVSFSYYSFPLTTNTTRYVTRYIFAGGNTDDTKYCEFKRSDTEILHFNGLPIVGNIFEPVRLVCNFQGVSPVEAQLCAGGNKYIVEMTSHFPTLISTRFHHDEICGFVLILKEL